MANRIPSTNKFDKCYKPTCILMVSMDNVCRSPIAEAVMRAVIRRLNLHNDWFVDSAAIESWNIGAKPDSRVMRVLGRHSLNTTCCARRIIMDDFEKFDYIIGMDQSNMASLRLLKPHCSKAKLLLLSDFLFGSQSDIREIQDPYYELGDAPIENIFEQCALACTNFFKQALVNKIIA